MKSQLSDEEKKEIFELTGVVLTGDRVNPFTTDSFYLEKEYANSVFAKFTPEVYRTDLNHDGVEEIFIQYPEYSRVGVSLFLFIKTFKENTSPI